MTEGMPIISDTVEMPKKVYRDGKWAYMTDMTQLEYIANKECEKFVLGEDVFFLAGLGFIMPKDSTYRDAINKK